MGSKRRRYSHEFKVEALRMAQNPDVSYVQVAEELRINPETLYRWKRELKDDPAQAFPGPGQMKPRDKEVEQLRQRVRRLESENVFLKKVSAYFAQEKK